MKPLVLSVALVAASSALVSSEAYEASVDKGALRSALEKYSSCNGKCAAELSQMVVEDGVDSVLTGFGAMKLQENSQAPSAIKKISWYAFLRRLYETGGKVIEANAACHSSCDKLNAEVVRLGRAGLLGPMLNGGEINPQVFENEEVLAAYLKFVKPIELPAEHRGREWWDLVRSTA